MTMSMSRPARTRTTRSRNRHPSPDVEALHDSINSHTDLHGSINGHAVGDNDDDDFDLRRNYQSAIDCLVQCDSVIRSLEAKVAARDAELAAKDEELASKDEEIAILEEKIGHVSPEPASKTFKDKDEELAAKDDEIAKLEETIAQMSLELDSSKAFKDKHEELAAKDEEIAILEERMVQMSLELASSKAFEDAHRSTRRMHVDFDDEGSDGDDALYLPPSRPAPLDISVVKKAKKVDRRRHSTSVLSADSATARTSITSYSNSSNRSFGSNDRQGSQGSGPSEDPAPRRLTVNLGRLFRGSLGSQGGPSPKDIAEEGDAARDRTGGTNPSASRRPPSQRRPGHPRTELQASLRSSLKKFLEAGTVVFPSSFEEAFTKGCLDVRDSLKRLSGDADWSGMLREAE